MTKRSLSTAVALSVIAALLLGAWWFRYEPIPQAGGGGLWVRVWDRWQRQVCVAPRPEVSDVTGIACSASEIHALLTRIGEDQDRKKEAELAAQKRRSEEAAKVAKSVASLPDKTGVGEIRKLRAAGFSEKAISDWVADLRAKMLAAGAPKTLVDDYFGGDPYAKQ